MIKMKEALILAGFAALVAGGVWYTRPAPACKLAAEPDQSEFTDAQVLVDEQQQIDDEQKRVLQLDYSLSPQGNRIHRPTPLGQEIQSQLDQHRAAYSRQLSWNMVFAGEQQGFYASKLRCLGVKP